MEVNKEIIPHGNGNQDFGDQLPPGYRFCPIDSELIVYYLSAKIESRKLPECRLHEVNIYNHKPEELAERYRSSENIWYFFTPRDRKYPKGDRPDRAVGNFGYWKTTQRHKPVYDASRQTVGYKGSLVFYEKINDVKINWLMHEYTTNEPNLPFGNGENSNKLNEWVLCKIYNKKRKTTANNHGVEQVGNISNQKEVIEEPTDIPSLKRKRASENNEIQTNTNNPFPNPMQPMTTFQDSNLIQVPAPSYQNHQITSNASNSFLFSDGASTSGSIEPPTAAVVQPLDYGCHTPVLAFNPVNYDILQQNVQNSYEDPKTLNVQSGSNHNMVVPDPIPQSDGNNATLSSPPDANSWIFDYLDGISFDDLDDDSWFQLPGDATISALDEIEWTPEYIDNCLFANENTSVRLVSDVNTRGNGATCCPFASTSM